MVPSSCSSVLTIPAYWSRDRSSVDGDESSVRAMEENEWPAPTVLIWEWLEEVMRSTMASSELRSDTRSAGWQVWRPSQSIHVWEEASERGACEKERRDRMRVAGRMVLRLG